MGWFGWVGLLVLLGLVGLIWYFELLWLALAPVLAGLGCGLACVLGVI